MVFVAIEDEDDAIAVHSLKVTQDLVELQLHDGMVVVVVMVPVP
jgi:hypothetical protein